MSVAVARAELGASRSLYLRVMQIWQQVGGVDDSPSLRAQLQDAIRALTAKLEVTRGKIEAVRDAGSPDAPALLNEFDTLQNEIRQRLGAVGNELRRMAGVDSERPSPGVRGPLLAQDQQQIDGETEFLEILEEQVVGLLRQLREIHQLSVQTFDELQKQRHVLVGIDTDISTSVEEVTQGNTMLREAHQHQKGSTRCLVWIAIIAGVVLVGLIVGIVLGTRRRGGGGGGTATNTTSIVAVVMNAGVPLA